MKNIRNLKRKLLTLTLTDGSTLRLFPESIVPLEENLISGDLYRAEIAGIIRIEDGVAPLAEKEVEVKVDEVPEVVKEEEPLPIPESEETPKNKPKKPSRRLDPNE